MRLIDADALITQMRSEMDADIGTDIQTLLAKGICERLCKWIDEQPTIEPMRKKGKWISADAMFGGVPFYCSECGENTRDTVMGKPRWNYCPNCGSYNGGSNDQDQEHDL